MFLDQVLRPDPTLYFNVVPLDIVTSVKQCFPAWTVGRVCYKQQTMLLHKSLKHIGVFSDNTYVLRFSNVMKWDDISRPCYTVYDSVVVDADDNVWISGPNTKIIQYARDGRVLCWSDYNPFTGLYDVIPSRPMTSVGVVCHRLGRKTAQALAPTKTCVRTEIEMHDSDLRKIGHDCSIKRSITIAAPCGLVLDAADNIIVRCPEAVHVFNLSLRLISTFDIASCKGKTVAIDKNGALLLPTDFGYMILHTY